MTVKNKRPSEAGKAPKSPHKKAKTGSSKSTKGQVEKPTKRPRKHAEIVEEAKLLWNQLRLKTNTKEQNRELMDKLMPLIKGKANEIALQHDASRVVQAAIQFGNDGERRLIVGELCIDQQLVELAKSQYAHFVVLKAIKYCQPPDCVSLILKALKGSMAKLAIHAVGSRVVELLFQTYPPKQTAILKQEFYGPHFSLFAADTLREQDATVPTLESNLAAAPEKKQQTLDFVRNILNKGMEKSLYAYAYFQELFAEYLAMVDPKEIRHLSGTAGDHAIQLLSTRAGTRVVAYLVAYGTAKDRKRILKSLKGYSRSGLLHADAYLAILRLVQLTDDTVSIQKNVFTELLATPTGQEAVDSPLLELALSDTASKLFFMLLENDTERRDKFFDPYEHSVLFPDPVIEEDGEMVPTSKKDAEARRNELLKHLKEPLVELCEKHAEELLRSRPGAVVLREVYSAFRPESLVKGVVDVCQKTISGKENLFEDRDGHLAIKNLILMDVEESPTLFAEAFSSRLAGRLFEVASSNRGAFVVASLCKVPSTRLNVVEELKASSGKLAKLSKSKKTATAGFAALLNEISGNR